MACRLDWVSHRSHILPASPLPALPALLCCSAHTKATSTYTDQRVPTGQFPCLPTFPTTSVPATSPSSLTLTASCSARTASLQALRCATTSSLSANSSSSTSSLPPAVSAAAAEAQGDGRATSTKREHQEQQACPNIGHTSAAASAACFSLTATQSPQAPRSTVPLMSTCSVCNAQQCVKTYVHPSLLRFLRPTATDWKNTIRQRDATMRFNTVAQREATT